MTLKELYLQEIHCRNYQIDNGQLAIIDILENIAYELKTNHQKSSFWKKIFSKSEIKNIKGLYCVGDVGRGKTFLMDLFFQYLPTDRKQRFHYHSFMLNLHKQLHELGNIKNPLNKVVSELKKNIDVLILDEFAVHDITDAMLLSKLFENLQKNNIVFMTTSNIMPDDLYKNGLQRERFLTAIEWLKNNLIIKQIDEGDDYRQINHKANIFLFPNNEENINHIKNQITVDKLIMNQEIIVNDRKLNTFALNEEAIIFEFKYLCEGNYSQKDYIDIAGKFKKVAIINIPIIQEDREDAAKRFLLLIDEFYDRRIKLWLCSQLPVEEIYQGKKFNFEYRRVQSRLVEMNSTKYLWQ